MDTITIMITIMITITIVITITLQCCMRVLHFSGASITCIV